MKSGIKVLIAGFVAIALAIATGYFYLRNYNIAVLQPSGSIGAQQRDLIVIASVMMAAVLVVVWGLCIWIAFRYRSGNKKASYAPEWDSNKLLEVVWWGIPLILIGVISVMTWNSSHSLDPFKPINSTKPPLQVQVVALQWKWLFIQPEQGIATVNNFAFPQDRPVEFSITSDAPMNSFWIPALGGQIYAMSGMSTKLFLDAKKVGVYDGYSSNISGEGFANMKFAAQALSPSDYANWVSDVASNNTVLDVKEYSKLSQPSKVNRQQEYSKVQTGLYNYILAKYLIPYGQLRNYQFDNSTVHNHGSEE